jgi:protein-tyrosine phosphatase
MLAKIFDLFFPIDSDIGGLLVGQVYLGNGYITTEWLNQHQIRDILEFGSPILQSLANELNCAYHFEDIRDFSQEADKLFKRFEPLVTYIHHAQLVGRPIVIVCPTGVSLSITIACAYMMKFYGANTDDALAYVRQQRPVSEVRESFKRVLRIYENVLRIQLLTQREGEAKTNRDMEIME